MNTKTDPQTKNVSLEQRERRLEQKGTIIWFTGLSGAGKTTLSCLLEKKLFDENFMVYVLDGDQVRLGLNKDLGYSSEDRRENIRRIGEVAKLFADGAFLVIVAFISPFRVDRDHVRQAMDPERFIEVFVDCPLKICAERDTKGLYKKAMNNEIPDFTGISSPYEPPLSPEIHLHTNTESIEGCVDSIHEYLKNNGAISVNNAP